MILFLSNFVSGRVTISERWIIKRVMPIVFLLPIIIIAMSCSVHYKDALEMLKKSTPCCKSLAEFKYEPISNNEAITFKLDQSADAFMFQTGKSYFRAFSLPKGRSPYYIYIKSFALGEDIKTSHIFYPQLALLDENFIVVKQSNPEDFALMKAGVSETASVSWTALRIKFDGSFFVDNPTARYAVIFTTEKLLSSSSAFSTIRFVPIIVPGIVGALPTGSDIVYIPHSPFGLLNIKIADKLSSVTQ